MADRAYIRVGGSIGIGSVALVGSGVRGEGGPHAPHLVLPLEVTMEARPVETMIALLDMTCSLHLIVPGAYLSEMNQLGPLVTVNLLPNLPCRSVPSGSSPSQVVFRFPVPPPLVTVLATHRHTSTEPQLD